jgi:hypothetical protein
LLLGNPLLLRSATAVASAHHTFSTRIISEAAILSRARSRAEATEALRENLSKHGSELLYAKMFIANALLCILDGMMELNVNSTVAHNHLRGGKAILDLVGCSEQLFSSTTGVSALMFSIIASTDLTHAILSDDMPYFDNEMGHYEAWLGVLDDNDPLFESTRLWQGWLF